MTEQSAESEQLTPFDPNDEEEAEFLGIPFRPAAEQKCLGSGRTMTEGTQRDGYSAGRCRVCGHWHPLTESGLLVPHARAVDAKPEHGPDCAITRWRRLPTFGLADPTCICGLGPTPHRRDNHDHWAAVCTCGLGEQERTGHYPEHMEWCDVPSPLDDEDEE